MTKPEWPTDESRIDIIGVNGPSGEHYEIIRIDKEIEALELQIENLNAARREHINKNNLNPRPEKL